MAESYDAVVVGAGPNGLAAAVTLARRGLAVRVVEAAETVGGGARTQELTLPGFRHDPCSAIHPLGAGSPVFRRWPLEEHGLEWLHPEIPLAHPLDDGTAAVLHRSLDDTVSALHPDGAAWRDLFGPLADAFPALAEDVLRPLLRPPRHPVTMLRFGPRALLPATVLARAGFAGAPAQALFAGLAGHAVLPLERWATSAIALVLGAAGHAVGWPAPRGGSQALSDALAAYLRSLGGDIETGRRVESLAELPDARAVLCDLTPRGLLAVAGERLPSAYRRRLARFRHGAGVFKVDYALDGPVPWTAPACRRAGTVHVGGTLEEIAAAEEDTTCDRLAERPYVLVAQQSLFDDSRAPAGQHTLWAYCHVPAYCEEDRSAAIEAQIERFAPGFRDLILARHLTPPSALERSNPNYVGGDIGGGSQDLAQVLARPTFGPSPYRTPVRGLYLCSSSTPPGGGVHGMCGHHAARCVLSDLGA